MKPPNCDKIHQLIDFDLGDKFIAEFIAEFKAYHRACSTYIISIFAIYVLEVIILAIPFYKLINRGQFCGLPLNVKIVLIALLLYTVYSVVFWFTRIIDDVVQDRQKYFYILHFENDY